MLLSVLVLAAIGVAVSSTLLLLSASGAQTAVTIQSAQAAKELANTCAQLGLEQLVANSSYLGSGTKTFSSGTCAYSVIQNGTGYDYVQAAATSSGAVRRVKVLITVPGRSIVTWSEVSDF